MDKYRIDTLRSQGLSHSECLAKMDHYTTIFPRIEDKIEKGDIPISASFLLLRATLWSIVYYIIFKIVEKSFSFLSSFYKCSGFSPPCVPASASASASDTCSLGCSFFKFPFLKNLPFSHASVTSHSTSSS